MKSFTTHIRTLAAAALLLVLAVAATATAVAQLPVRSRDVQLISNNNTNYTSLQSVNGQTSNWTLVLPPTAGATGSLMTTTVGGSTATASWLAPGTEGQALVITGGVPAWGTPASGWLLLGNASTDPLVNFLGTTDAQPLVVRTDNAERIRVLSTGEVGIGTATPTHQLEVAGSLHQAFPFVGGTAELHSGPNAFGIGVPGIGLSTTNTVSSTLSFVGLGDFSSTTVPNAVIGSVASLGGDGAVGEFAFDDGASQYTIDLTTTNSSNALNSRVFLYAGASELSGVAPTGTFNLSLSANTATATLDVSNGVDGNSFVVRPTEVQVSQYPNTRNDIGVDTPINFLYTTSLGNVRSGDLTSIQIAWSRVGNGGTNPATNFLGTTDAQPLVVRTDNAERLRINATGEVGIGITAAAGYSLQVAGTAGTANVRLGSVSGASITSAFTPTANDGLIVADVNGDLVKRSASSVLNATAWLIGGNTLAAAGDLGTNDAFGLNIRTNSTSRITVGATGDIALLGTAGTPNVTLTSVSGVAGATVPVGFDRALIADATGQVSQASFSAILASGAWTLAGNSGTNPTSNFVGTIDAQPLVLRTTNVERLRVNATGEVGIGITAAAGYSLHVGGTAGTPNVRLASVGGAAVATAWAPTANDGVITADDNGDLSKRTAQAVVNAGLSGLSGTVNLTAGSTSIVVPNTNIAATSRIVVTYEDANAAGFVATMVTTRVVGASFTVAFSGPIPAGATGRLHYIIVNP